MDARGERTVFMDGTMNGELSVRYIDLVGVLSRALDMVSNTLAQHHVRVGYVTARIASHLGLPEETQRELLVAAMLHDIGALSLHESVDSLRFESDMETHAHAGFLFLQNYPRLERVSRLVRCHHTPWSELAGEPAGNIITLADFVDIRLKREQPAKVQLPAVAEAAMREGGDMFACEFVEALVDLVESPDGFAHLDDPESYLLTDAPDHLEKSILNTEEVLQFANLIAQVIDFRSQFTATHSRGVAETGKLLAAYMGLSEQAQQKMYIAGLLHDVGKLAVPRRLLEKNGRLDSEEFIVVRHHATLTETLLTGVKGLEMVGEWAFQHHERINGTGYPNGRSGGELSLGSRILQVADVFTAITEDRPYRAGMSSDAASNVLLGLSSEGGLDSSVVNALLERYDEINTLRASYQQQVRSEYDAFYARLHEYDSKACIKETI